MLLLDVLRTGTWLSTMITDVSLPWWTEIGNNNDKFYLWYYNTFDRFNAPFQYAGETFDLTEAAKDLATMLCQAAEDEILLDVHDETVPDAIYVGNGISFK